jgi:AcrR family transcriptional regulator
LATYYEYQMTTTGTPPPAAQPPGPMRADARRNRERLLIAARSAFAETGADAPLDDIARRAGVGIGTLYRHFPTRLDLQEAVFRDQVEALCDGAGELLSSHDPGAALNLWLRSLTAYVATKRGLSSALMAALGKDSELVSSCSAQMKAAGTELLRRAQEAGAVRRGTDIGDLLRLVHAIVLATEQAPADDGQRDRLLSLVLDGLRVQEPGAPETGSTTSPGEAAIPSSGS